MLRSLALFGFVVAVTCSLAVAQNTPKSEKIKATPEILALFDESFQSLAQVEPRQRAEGYFQLLNLGTLFDDKVPAKKVIENILALAPSLEPEELRNQLYEGVAHALCDLEENSEAVGVLNRIAKPADRYEPQQNLALKLIMGQENDKIQKLFDVSMLLHQAIGGALAVQDFTSEVVSRVLLGRELARQGKKDEATVAFANALTATKNLGAVEQGQITALIIQSQVQVGLVADALATLQTIADPTVKLNATYAIVQMLTLNDKHDDAEKLLKNLPSGQTKDSLLLNLVVGNEKTLTDEKIGEFASQVSSEERRNAFIQQAVVLLMKENRGDVANQIAKWFNDPADAKRALLIGELQLTLDKKQFAEAIQFIDKSGVDAELRRNFKRSVWAIQYNETHDDSVAGQFSETYSNEEKMSVAELRETAKQAVEIPDPDLRMDTLLEIFQEQARFLDAAGQKQTLKMIAEQLDKETAPVRIIECRLLLARLQVAVREKNGAKENLGKLMQTLAGIRDLKVLKDLVPEQTAAQPLTDANAGGALKLNIPGAGREPAIDESAIKNQLFQVNVMAAALLLQADAPMESKSALEKAKELAKADPDAAQKAEKLLILAQFMAEQ